MEKKCKKCGVVKSVEEFWKSPRYSSGRFARCSKCMKRVLSEEERAQRREKALTYYREHRTERIAYLRKYHRENAEALNAKRREKYAENPDAVRASKQKYYGKYRHDPEYRRRSALTVSRWNRENRWHPRICAQKAVALAIRSGCLKRLPCEKCGTTENIHAHHHKGYTLEHWFSVQWLCRQHHKEAHGMKHWV